MAIIVGLLNILSHNVWELSYRLVITLIGWISLLIGLALFIMPKLTVDWLEYINIKLVQVFYILLFLIGLFLLNQVYAIIAI